MFKLTTGEQEFHLPSQGWYRIYTLMYMTCVHIYWRLHSEMFCALVYHKKKRLLVPFPLKALLPSCCVHLPSLQLEKERQYIYIYIYHLSLYCQVSYHSGIICCISSFNLTIFFLSLLVHCLNYPNEPLSYFKEHDKYLFIILSNTNT